MGICMAVVQEQLKEQGQDAYLFNMDHFLLCHKALIEEEAQQDRSLLPPLPYHLPAASSGSSAACPTGRIQAPSASPAATAPASEQPLQQRHETLQEVTLSGSGAISSPGLGMALQTASAGSPQRPAAVRD